MRLFFGTFLNAANQDVFEGVVRNLTQRHGDILRSIPQKSAHVTYVFCADTGLTSVEALLAAIRHISADRQAVAIRIGPPHVISAGPIPRLVVAALVHGADALRGLTADLAREAQAAFPGLEWRPSREPHVTLARFRKHARRSDGEMIVRALGAPEYAGVTRDDRLAVVQAIESTLTPTGPAYRLVGEIPLS